MVQVRLLALIFLSILLLARADVSASPGPSPAPSSSWQATGIGWGSGGGFPADPQIAASTSHVVVTTRAYIGYYDKAGTQLQTVFTPTFFNSILPGFSFFDTRTIFDSYRKRFVVGALAYNGLACSPPPCSGDVSSYFAIGVSKTEDPQQGWYLYYLNAVDKNPRFYQAGDNSDYPSVGVDKDAIYITNSVCNGGLGKCSGNATYPATFRYWYVYWANATQMANGANNLATNAYVYVPTAGAPALIQPVIHHTGLLNDEAPRAYFVSQLSATQIRIWGLTSPFGSYQMSSQDITLPNGEQFVAPVDAPQLGSGKLIHMTNLGNQPLKAVYRNGFLWIVFSDASTYQQSSGPYTSVHLLKLDVNSFPNIDISMQTAFRDLVFEGRNPSDPQGQYFYSGWPAVETNLVGDAVVVDSRSSASIYPQIRYSVLYPLETGMRDSQLLKAGESIVSSPCPANVNYCWMSGDTGGASADPDNASVWVAHAYAKSNGFQIWVGRVFPEGSKSVSVGTSLLLLLSASTAVIVATASSLFCRRPRIKHQ